MGKKTVLKTMVSMELPKVGDHLKRVMSAMTRLASPLYEPLDCVVVHVNKDKRWYEVEFVNTGLRECYGLPTFDHTIIKDPQNYPVLCLETGYVYSSVTDCARDMGFTAGNISRQILGEFEQYHGYHFTTVL